MKRILNLEQGIIDGDSVRGILKVFPEIESRFKQRKWYDEYYYDGVYIEWTVELTLDKISSLSNLGFTILITWDSITLS